MIDFSQYTLNKILLAVGSFAGVSIMNVLWQPKFVKRKGVIAAAMVTTAVSVTLSVTAGGALLVWLGVDQSKADIVLFVGGAIGFFGPFALNALRNFFSKYEDSDAIEVVNEVKDSFRG